MVHSSRGIFLVEREQLVRCPLDDVFSFFSSPRNLEALTPPWLHFRMLGSSTTEIQGGTTIDYRLRLHGIPFCWRSVISSWNPPFGFVDEQLKGPYRSWYHEHKFKEAEDGVLVSDRVHYSVPGGGIVNTLFVKRDLTRIFDYRRDNLTRLLPEDGNE